MAKKGWQEWIKYNILDIITLILVLVLVINTFSARVSTTEEQPQESQEITGGEEVEEKPSEVETVVEEQETESVT